MVLDQMGYAVRRGLLTWRYVYGPVVDIHMLQLPWDQAQRRPLGLNARNVSCSGNEHRRSG
jgi:hypothetical protein